MAAMIIIGRHDVRKSRHSEQPCMQGPCPLKGVTACLAAWVLLLLLQCLIISSRI
jgi:hypothetical protein